MSSSGGNQSRSGAGGQVEEAEEDEDSSSSSSSTPTVVEDELEIFRQQWKQEVSIGASGSNMITRRRQESEDDKSLSIEERARDFFLAGVEHEQNGEMFEAIQKYRKAVALVPDIEFKTYSENIAARRRNQGNPDSDQGQGEDVASDEEVPELPEDPEVDRETSEVDLLSKFSRFTIKNPALCDPNQPTNFTHISSLPMEVLSDILKWVVSSELDLRSLENFSQVCRGFFVASRASNIWRLVCVKTWGVAGIPLEEPGMGGWRELYLSRPRVNLNGCYISRVSYLREGERGFQDNEFYKSWHVVHYHRILRFFAGGRVVMVTTSEDPSMAVKLLNSRYSCAIPGCMFGHYRTLNNRVLCVVQRAKTSAVNSNRFSQRQRQRRQRQPYYYEVPDQGFHFELEIKGKRNHQLQWLCYSVIGKYQNGQEQLSDIDVTNPTNYPVMHFSRVKSYTAAETLQPLK